ncbi:MAG: hypothetical protein BWY98_00380 [Tenericutes bacterium ADurb.BinA155]|nr:MAG: hypothetical protein BWY98_00380 [Tenericutes bacterium ADurb.BinA155]
MVGVHENETSDSLGRAARTVFNVASGLQDTLIDPDIGEPAHEGIGRDFEGQANEGLVIGRFANIGLFIEHAFFARNIDRGRQIVDDSVEQGLNALVLVSGSAEDREERSGQNGFTDGFLDEVDRDILAIENHHHEIIVKVGEFLDEGHPISFDFVLEFGRDFDLLRSIILVVGIKIADAIDDIDAAAEIAFFADRALNGGSVGR